MTVESRADTPFGRMTTTVTFGRLDDAPVDDPR
jgi:hypothetical protein